MNIPEFTRQLCIGVCVGAIALSASASSNDNVPDIETYGYQHIDPRDADIFSVPFPGETYDALSGQIGQRFTDLVASGNGTLPINIQRDFKEIPKAYPYAFGNMDLVVPHLTIETAWTAGSVGNGDSGGFGDLDFKCAITGTPSSTNDNFQSSWRRISFDYEGGRIHFVKREFIKATTLSHYPVGAKFISPDNWLISCATDNPSIFEVKSPDGTTYRLIQRERFQSRRGYMDATGRKDNLTLNTTFMILPIRSSVTARHSPMSTNDPPAGLSHNST